MVIVLAALLYCWIPVILLIDLYKGKGDKLCIIDCSNQLDLCYIILETTRHKYLVIDFLSYVSDLILCLSHCQTFSDLCSAYIVNEFRLYVSFTGFAFYIAICCAFTMVRYKRTTGRYVRCK